MGSVAAKAHLERLRRAHAKVAGLVVADPIYAPIFVRLEAEIADAEAMLSDDVITRARAVARQSANA